MVPKSACSAFIAKIEVLLRATPCKTQCVAQDVGIHDADALEKSFALSGSLWLGDRQGLLIHVRHWALGCFTWSIANVTFDGAAALHSRQVSIARY